MRKKVEVKIDPELDKIFKKDLMAPNRIELETEGGKRYSKEVEFVKGHPKNPMTLSEVIDKFHDCVRFSAKKFREDNVTKLTQLASNLEKVDDVREIITLLVA